MTLRQATFFAVLALSSAACRTLDPGAEEVTIVAKADGCKDLGVVNVNWTWWGATDETLNTMRNQTRDKGGNRLVVLGDAMGMAYACPNEPSPLM